MTRRDYRLLFIILAIIILLSQVTLAAQVHRVEPGESLFSIARDYGVEVEEIISTSNLRNTREVFPRQVLIIPPESVYYVRKGDTLSQIAEDLNIELDRLIAENNLSNSDYIWPGQVLQIPWREKEDVLVNSFKIYEVQPGDSLHSISHQFGIAVKTLAGINDISDMDKLEAGQLLNIPEYSFSELRQLYPEHFFHHKNTDSPKIALTFDDGPDDIYTSRVLDVLKEHQVPATFFYMGSKVERYPEVVKRTVEEGHVIANHSWSHPQLINLTDLEVYDEIKKTEIAMEEISGLRSGLIRPPYGLISQKLLEQLKSLDYRVIQWSVDSVDWRDRDVDQILINTIPDTEEGSIILFHTSSGGQSLQATVDVLPELIYTLKTQDYEFVTVDELLDIPAYLN